jgi:ATPase subunit of ABC transporter with duplicated ATPase domains
MISASNLGKSYGDRVLFEDASFQLNPGERYGLVGANGSGKTTLLNILSGDAEASEGSVSIPEVVRLGVLRQDQFLYEDEDVLDVTLMGNPELWNVLVEKEALLARAHEYFDGDRFSELEETVQRLDGYTAEARAATILEGLGLPAEVHRKPLSTLSGGFKLRVLLAQVLASAPDVLLLDEPTNHLDIISIRWLEKFLQDYTGPVVVISHDHRFLDNVATSILDVDYQTVTLYKGNYTAFVEEKWQRAGAAGEGDRGASEGDRPPPEVRRPLQGEGEQGAAGAEQAPDDRAQGGWPRGAARQLAPLSEVPLRAARPSGKEVLKIRGLKKAFGRERGAPRRRSSGEPR